MSHPYPSSTNLSIIRNSLLNPLNIESGEKFLEKYKLLIAKIIKSHGISGPDADDLVQETLQQILVSFGKFHRLRPGSFRAWLRKITHSTIVDWFRSRKRHHLAIGAKIGQSVSASLIQELDREIYEIAVRKVRLEVSPDQWTIFEMFRLNGVPTNAVAKKFGITPHGVYKANQRVFSRLKQLVTEIMRGELT